LGGCCAGGGFLRRMGNIAPDERLAGALRSNLDVDMLWRVLALLEKSPIPGLVDS